jgi:tetratricopeptide (TPR) repeat protein
MAATSDTGNALDGDQPRTRWQKIGGWLGRNAGNVLLPALTVLVTAVAGFFAARYAHGAIVAADAQKVVAQQQELLALVVDIEQEPAAEERATAPLHGTPLVNTQVQFADELISYAEAAQLIIGNLARGDVTSFEYVQVGKALADSGNNAVALRYFQRALAATSATPATRAAALRNEAHVRDQLGEIGRTHQEDMQAVRVFSTGFPDETASAKANNLALTYSDDADDELAARNCQLAHDDLHDVRLLFGRHRLAPRRDETEQTSSMIMLDQAGYQKRCRG